MADTNRLGYEGGALVFGAGLALVAAGYFFTNVSRTLLFWAAFILTRPLGATLGDLLDKPVDHGGFAFSRYSASGILVALIVACILFLPQKAGSHPGQGQRQRREGGKNGSAKRRVGVSATGRETDRRNGVSACRRPGETGRRIGLRSEIVI